MATEGCRVHDNHNPGKIHEQIEAELLLRSGASKTIRLPGITGYDVTKATSAEPPATSDPAS